MLQALDKSLSKVSPSYTRKNCFVLELDIEDVVEVADIVTAVAVVGVGLTIAADAAVAGAAMFVLRPKPVLIVTPRKCSLTRFSTV